MSLWQAAATLCHGDNSQLNVIDYRIQQVIILKSFKTPLKAHIHTETNDI